IELRNKASVKSTFTSRATFSRHLNDLLVIGFSKAQLQQMQGNNLDNVVPLLQVIEIDFSQQRPSDWVEPIGNITKMYGLENNVINLVA
uniref:phage/plasmid replication protein, II/X family n=1 Tax=Vibrio coralliirubri TaxID=1516159 RepID=UPI001EE48BD0